MRKAFSRKGFSDSAPHLFRYRVGAWTASTSGEFGEDLSRLLPRVPCTPTLLGSGPDSPPCRYTDANNRDIQASAQALLAKIHRRGAATAPHRRPVAGSSTHSRFVPRRTWHPNAPSHQSPRDAAGKAPPDPLAMRKLAAARTFRNCRLPNSPSSSSHAAIGLRLAVRQPVRRGQPQRCNPAAG